jgi:hypothetical protein
MRHYPADQLRARPVLRLFKLGSAPPWEQSKSGGTYRQTFEFMGKFTGHKYYTTDFSAGEKAALRP